MNLFKFIADGHLPTAWKKQYASIPLRLHEKSDVEYIMVEAEELVLSGKQFHIPVALAPPRGRPFIMLRKGRGHGTKMDRKLERDNTRAHWVIVQGIPLVNVSFRSPSVMIMSVLPLPTLSLVLLIPLTPLPMRVVHMILSGSDVLQFTQFSIILRTICVCLRTNGVNISILGPDKAVLHNISVLHMSTVQILLTKLLLVKILRAKLLLDTRFSVLIVIFLVVTDKCILCNCQ